MAFNWTEFEETSEIISAVDAIIRTVSTALLVGEYTATGNALVLSGVEVRPAVECLMERTPASAITTDVAGEATKELTATAPVDAAGC